MTPEARIEKIIEAKTTADNLLANIKAGFLFMLLQKSGSNYLHPSIRQFTLLILLSLFIPVVFQVIDTGLHGEINPDALPYLLYDIPWLLLAGWVSVKAAGDESLTVRAITALAAVNVIANTISAYLILVPSETWNKLGELAWPIWYSPFIWQILASIVAINRACQILPEERMGTVLSVLCLMLLPYFMVSGNSQLWMPRYEKSTSDEDENRWDNARNENMLYQQHKLLDDQLSKIAFSRNQEPQLYLVSVAGYGSQNVFMREVLSVKKLFDERFGTQNHSIALINNPETVTQYSIASVTAIQKTLTDIGNKMNKENDTLFLFMTSHGAKDYQFSLSLWPYTMNEMTPEVLLKILDDSDIKNRVIVVSACYSGGFVPKLANENTLVMSASRDDRNSHGCSHEAEWTFFGKAYFDEALRETKDFEAAFYKAQEAINKREETEQLKHSEPQIAIGDKIKIVLEKLREQNIAITNTLPQ